MKKSTILRGGLIILIIVIIIGLGIIGYMLNTSNSFWGFNLMELLTFGIASVLIYFFSEFNNKKRKRQEKIENMIIEINAKISQISTKTPSMQLQKEYLYIFKYVSNKFSVLEKLIDENDKEHLSNAKNEFEKLRDFVNDNINQSDDYFERLREKIPNYASNIESNLDKIIVNIYSNN